MTPCSILFSSKNFCSISRNLSYSSLEMDILGFQYGDMVILGDVVIPPVPICSFHQSSLLVTLPVTSMKSGSPLSSLFMFLISIISLPALILYRLTRLLASLSHLLSSRSLFLSMMRCPQPSLLRLACL